MNPLIQFRKVIAVAIVLLLVRFAVQLAPNAFGVVPPPDGGYPNFSTAEGQNALKNLTTGAGNTAIGWYSLFSATAASFNTGIGAGTLALNMGDENTATGVAALLLNTTGANNTANGALALLHNTTGNQNTATGSQALSTNTEGARNTADGFVALSGNITGSDNTAVGSQALVVNTVGNQNTAVGGQALFFNGTGNNNTAIGDQALFNNDTGNNNTAIGNAALFNNVGGGLFGNNNTAIGFDALLNNTGAANTAVGSNALGSDTLGAGNTALGKDAGSNQTSGNNNVYIGNGIAGVAGESNACYIASIFGQTSASGVPVFINASNKLGTSTSSKRFKEDIKPMEKASEMLYALKPVTFRYKKEIDPAGTSQLGLVAEDVEKVNRDLVARDKEGKPYSVRYDQVNAMLLNEFLKEHATVRELKKEIADLKAGLQGVSDQLKMSRPVQLADNRE
jgi:hypothetical protein